MDHLKVSIIDVHRDPATMKSVLVCADGYGKRFELQLPTDNMQQLLEIASSGSVHVHVSAGHLALEFDFDSTPYVDTCKAREEVANSWDTKSNGMLWFTPGSAVPCGSDRVK